MTALRVGARSGVVVLLALASLLMGFVVADSSVSAAVECPTRQVLLLMDQSQSLESTDPDNLRIAGAKELISSLSDVAEASGTKVELVIGGFGVDAQRIGESTLTLPDKRGDASGAVEWFVDKKADLNTDYILALEFAADFFATSPGTPAECKQLVWFTDGAYSIDDLGASGIGKYTSSRNKGTIQSQLDAQVCGPLPEGSALSKAVSTRVNEAGFAVQMIDLRVEGKEKPQDRSERAQTRPVIDRMFNGDIFDPCHIIKGTRVQVASTSELATAFFSEGQRALGLSQIDCGLFSGTDGYPASMVKAFAAKGTDPSTPPKVELDGKSVGVEKFDYVGYFPKSISESGSLRLAGGAAGVCFVDLDASVNIQSTAEVYGRASESYVSVAIHGAGSKASGVGIGAPFTEMTATVDGQPTEVVPDRAAGSFRLKLVGPFSKAPEVVVTATAATWKGAPFPKQVLSLAVVNEPPAPQVAWSGETTIEGAKTVNGSLVVTPSAVTGGQICVTPGAAKIQPANLSDIVAVAVEIDGGQNCGPDSGPFSIPATLTTAKSINATAEIELPLEVSYTPKDSTPIDVKSDGALFAPIKLAKPVDSGSVLLVTLAFLLFSVLLTLGLLLATTNYQLRLPDLRRYRSISVPVEVVDGVITRSSSDTLKMDDYGVIRGDTRSFALSEGISLVRRWTANPFTDPSAKVKAKGRRVYVSPSLSKGFAKAHDVPSKFKELTFVSLEESMTRGEIVAIVRAGTEVDAVSRLVETTSTNASRDIERAKADAPAAAGYAGVDKADSVVAPVDASSNPLPERRFEGPPPRVEDAPPTDAPNRSSAPMRGGAAPHKGSGKGGASAPPPGSKF
jgi:hypothetical protein